MWAECFTSLGTQWGSFDASLQNCDLNLTSGSFPKGRSGTTKEGCILLPLTSTHNGLCVWKISYIEEYVCIGQREVGCTECHDVMCQVVPGYNEPRLPIVQSPGLLTSTSLCALSNLVIQ